MEEPKNYGIFRIEKIKLSDAGELMGRLKHMFREFKNSSFAPELSKLNNHFLLDSSKEVMKAYKERIKSITKETYKPASNSVGCYECIYTTTAGAIPKENENEFFERSYNTLCKVFGKENVLAGVSHSDETTIHSHWIITPIYNTVHMLRRTKKEKDKGLFRTRIQPQLNATHWTGTPALLSQLQDVMWAGVFKHFNLERGETALPPDRAKKRKNVRSDLRKRDEALKQKEKSLSEEENKLEIQAHNLSEEAERLSKVEEKQNERARNLLCQASEIKEQQKKVETEMKNASEKAFDKYKKLRDSEELENDKFPDLPNPENNETCFHYRFRIQPIVDALKYKIGYFVDQIKELKKKHQEEIEQLKSDLNAEHKADLEQAKTIAEEEKQNAVRIAVQAKSDEKDITINSLKQEIQKEKSEKEKWYTTLFKKFSLKIGDKVVEEDKGLADAYIEKSNKLEEWEHRDGDELINLGNNYKKLHAHNWKDFMKLKSKAKTVVNDIVR